jgi:hypothetical protein
MDQVSIAIAGFAAVSAVLLFFAYAVFVNVPGKSVYSISSGTIRIEPGDARARSRC